MRFDTRSLFAVIAALSVLGAASEASVIGLPGSTWGEASRDVQNREGWGTMGNIQQGIDLAKLPQDHYFDTYVKASWRFRENNPQYFDAWWPGAGAEIRGSFYRVGIEYAHTRYTELGESIDTAWAQIVWYKGWRLLPIFPGSTWGALTHSFDDYEGSGSQGYVNQGVEVAKLPFDSVLTAFGEYRWRIRELHPTYYDIHGPAVGADVRRDAFRLGYEHYWERLPRLSRWEQRDQFFVTWYFAWDLAHRR